MWHVVRIAEKMCTGLYGKAEGKKPLGRLRHRWKGNIKINL